MNELKLLNTLCPLSSERSSWNENERPARKARHASSKSLGKGGARGKGMKCGRILRIKVLGYADDLALVEEKVDAMTARFTKIADASLEHADMQVNIDKTLVNVAVCLYLAN